MAECAGFSDVQMVATPNDTSYAHDTATYVTCNTGYRLSGYHVIVCQNGAWDPGVPECLQVDDKSGASANNIIIIAVCVVASIIALIIIATAAYILTKNWRRAKATKKEQEEFKRKVIGMSMERVSSLQDYVGMPPLVYDNIDMMMDGRRSYSSTSSHSATQSTSPEITLEGEQSASSDKVFIY